MDQRIVIVGGGVIGTSIAWHLARAEAGEIELVERDKLGCGTTWHSAGNVIWFSHRHDEIMTAFETIERVAKEADQETGWIRTGRTFLARSEKTMAWFEGQAQIARSLGVETRLLKPKEVSAYNPLIASDAIVGAWLVSAAGRVNPADLTTAYARAARRRGVTIRQDCAVHGIETLGGMVAGLATSQGQIDADIVIVAAGLWSRRLLAPLGIALGQWGCEHFYIIQRLTRELPRAMPSFVSPDDSIYGREEVGGLLFGCFDADALTLDLDHGAPADGFAFSLLNENWDQFGPYAERAFDLFPALREAPVHRFVNGPETFTPDGEPLIGPIASIDGLYVASAMNSGGVTLSAPVGELVADLVTGAEPRFDPKPYAPDRFADKPRDEAWLRAEVSASPSSHYRSLHD